MLVPDEDPDCLVYIKLVFALVPFTLLALVGLAAIIKASHG